MGKGKWSLQNQAVPRIFHSSITATSNRVKLVLIVLGVLTLCVIIIVSRTPRVPFHNDPYENLPDECYLPISPDRKDFNEFLLDISKDPEQPRQGRSIFFHETSCSKDYKIGLNARQSCAIESAAKMHPDRDVYVLFNSPRKIDNSSVFVNALMDYKNIRLRNVDMWEYAKGTLVEDWTKENVLFTSDYLTAHMADFMRFLSLSKYRGTHLDLDVIVKRNFDEEEWPNFSCAQDSTLVGAGLISFNDSWFGRLISQMCLKEFKKLFWGQRWDNSPIVITSVLNTVCETNNTGLMTAKQCHGFNLLPVNKCYAIPYPRWDKFFDPNESEEVFEMLNDSLIAHVWNKMSINQRVTVGDGSAYDLLAKQYCPKVYSVSGQYF